MLDKQAVVDYLTMKSNCETASMVMPSRVETAPWTTGENTGSTVITARLLREEPIVVKNVCNDDILFSVSTILVANSCKICTEL